MGARFEIPPGARLRVATASGHISLIAEDRQDLEVEPPDRRVELEHGGRVVDVRSRSSNLEIRCPRGIDVSIGAISGHVRLAGEFGSVKVSAVSGHIEVDSTQGDVDVRAVSGHLSVKACGGRCKLNTKSGRITVGRVEKEAHASTISGNVELGTAGGGDVEVKTISGRVTVRVVGERHPRVRMRSFSGKTVCDCPQGSDFEVRASSLSGTVEIVGASIAP